MRNLFVIIPAYNEAENITRVVAAVKAQTPFVVVIDDGSTDGTEACACTAGATVIRHLVNRGQGAALQTGIRYALRHDADLLVTFDADGQHTAEDIPRLITAMDANRCDVVLGSRFLGHGENMSIIKWALLKAAIFFTWLVSGIRLTDAHNGLRLLSRNAAEKIVLRCDRMAHASELVDQVRAHALSFREVPVTVTYAPGRHKEQGIGSALKIGVHYLLRRVVR